VARDPQKLVGELGSIEHLSDAQAPPNFISRPIDAPAALDPVRHTDELNALHQLWADAHVEQNAAPNDARRSPRHQKSSSDATERALTFDRALIGALIRANDALAVRADVLAERLGRVESLLAEVTNTLGAELTHLRAQLIQSKVPQADVATRGGVTETEPGPAAEDG
jgi:hypothetical protein